MSIAGMRTTYRLVSMGILPAWAAVLLAAGAAAVAFLLLRGELRRRGRRRAPALLYAARTLIALCLGVLVAQPVLFIRREWDQPGVLALIADRSRSMLRADPYPDATRLDLASALRWPAMERRETLPGRLRQHLLGLEPAAEAWRQQVSAMLDELGQGLPGSTAFEETVNRLAKEAADQSLELRGLVEDLGKLEARFATPAEREPSGGSAAPDPKMLAPVYLLADRLASLRDALGKFTGEPLDEPRAAGLLAAHDALLASLRAALPGLGALQNSCDKRFLAGLPQATAGQLAALSKVPRFGLAASLARRIAEDPLLAARHRVRLIGYEELAPANALDSTDLFAPIDLLLRESRDEVLSGVVLLTDGRQNLPERPEVLRRLVARGAALILAGVGSGAEPPSLAIEDCQAPGLLLAGQEATLVADIQAKVPRGTPIQVELSAGPKSLATQSIEAGSSKLRVALTFRAPESAEHPLLLNASCHLSPADGPQPSASCLLAPCVLNEPARVLVVAKWARWDIVYLLSALRGKPCRVDLALWGAAGDSIGRGSGFGKIPNQLSQLARYSLVVLDGEHFPGMTQEDGQMLSGYVRDLGGALLIIADGAPSYGEKLSAEFGLRLADAGPDGRESEVASPGSTIRNPQSAIRILPCAPWLPAVSLSLDPTRTLGAWEALPPAQRLSAVPDQAIPLLAADGRTLLNVGFQGRGKVYAFGCGDLFRLREWGHGEMVQRFLSNLLDDALQPAFRPSAGSGRGEPAEPREGKAQLALYPFAPRAGSIAHVLLDIRETTGKSGASPDALSGRVVLTPRLGEPAEAPLAFEPLPGSPGLAHAAFRVAAAGRITVEVPRVAPLHAAAASAVSREDIDFTLDEATLRRLARSAGGAYVPLPDLARAVADLPERLDHRVSLRQIRLWDFWGLLPALAALMVLDWVLRRRSGLVL